MSIVSAFNDIAVAQGGTADTSGTLVGAIDALNDALAGSPQEAAKTIEGAINLLGENIGGGASSYQIKVYTASEADVGFEPVVMPDTYCYQSEIEWDDDGYGTYVPPSDPSAPMLSSAAAGDCIIVNLNALETASQALLPEGSQANQCFTAVYIVPSFDDFDPSTGSGTVEYPWGGGLSESQPFVLMPNCTLVIFCTWSNAM